MSILLLISSFSAGILTILAPCVLPLLPVIISGSVSGDTQDKRRPFIVAASLAVSLLVFTLFFKATTLFINVPTGTITAVSGGIIVAIGIVMLQPALYEKLILTFNLQAKSQQLLGAGRGKGMVLGPIIIGAALGPVFSSCSPVYLYILATVLPANIGVALVYLAAYIAGLAGMLLLVGILGQKLVRRLGWAVNPKGLFTRIMAIVFIIVGFMVMSGLDKQLQTYVAEHTPFDFDSISSKLIP